MSSNPEGETRNPAGRPDTLQYVSRSGMYAVGRRVVFFRRTIRGEPDPTLLSRRPLYLVAVITAIGAVLLAQPLLFIGALLLFMIAVVPELWYRYGARGLAISREPERTRVAFGERVGVRVRVENRSPLPLPWLEIDDEFPEALPLLNAHVGPSPKAQRVVLAGVHALWAYQRVRRRYYLLACARGPYVFGPAKVSLSDPFGLLTREVELPATASLLVHPIVAPLERFGLRPDAPFGERKARRRLLEDPLRVIGTRDYVPGDEPRRIHWKATARTGMLQSKVYDPSTRHTLAIFLDTRTFSHLHLGYDPDVAELAICAAASVAQWGVDQGYAAGVYSNGAVSSEGAGEEAAARLAVVREEAARDDPDRQERLARAIAQYSGALRLRIPPAAREEQLMHVLDGLARVLPYHGAPMAQVLASELPRLPPGSTVVYIGADTVVDVPLIVALRRARALGHNVSLLLTRGPRAADAMAASTDRGGQEGSDILHLSGLDSHVIGGRETWRELRLDALGPEGVRLADEAGRFKPGTLDTRQSRPGQKTDPGASGGDQASGEVSETGESDVAGEHPAGAGAYTTGGRALVVE